MRKRNSLLLLPLLFLSACSAPVMQGIAQGLANYNQSQYATGQQSQSKNVCVKYATNAGWSKGYTVNADIMDGSELNSATQSYNYESYATYAVVFWGDDQASILKMNSYYGSISPSGHMATDQRGRRWQVSPANYCY